VGGDGAGSLQYVGQREPVLMPLRPGEIYWANLVDGGRRPIVIVSREELNRGRSVVGVGVTSSRLEVRRRLPNCVPFHAGKFGLTKDCVVQAESIAVFDLAHLDLESGPLGILDAQAMRDLTRAVGYMMDAECEPA